MEKYNLEQTGQEVQNILNEATTQSELTAETERAQEAERLLGEGIQQNATDIDSIEGKIPSAATSENKLTDKEYVDGQVDDEKNRAQGVEGTLQDNIDAEESRAKAAEKQNADDIDALEAVVPSGATSENKLATESYVNDAVATSSATFRGTFNLVSDLHLTLEATHANIATALAAAIATADNNDFAFVLIPTDAETPTVIGSIERYKFNGTDWAYEYTLNNSGFTQAQWDAINSGITSGDVAKLAALPTNAQLTTLLAGLQSDIDGEEARAQGAEGMLQDNIDAEEARAKAAEKQNADDIDAIEAVIPESASSENKVATENEINSLSAAIEAILLLIPSAATSLNKLADKAFVNSSIATATATFRGTYNLVDDLGLTTSATHAQISTALGGAILTANNNDYAFVQIPTSTAMPTEIAKTERYKFNGTLWEYEYDLNNSGFTADQWAAINSGITQALVTKLSALPTNAELTTELGTLTSGITTINQKIPNAASQANKLVDTAAMESYIVEVLNVLTISYNVTSTDGHVTVQISQVDGKITSVAVSTSDIASAADLNLKASQADLTALASRVTTAEGNITSLGGRVSTNEADIAALQALYNALQQSKPVPVDALPETGQQQGVIYRLAGTTSYSDYMWNGSTWVLMATYNNAIDPRPKKASQNLVTSGGVFDNMGALDVSELNATENPHTLAQYVDLSAALAAIPTDYQKGGMTIKFVQSSDNKYVQYRNMNQNWSTTESDWQGVDDEPIAGSKNLLESGGVKYQDDLMKFQLNGVSSIETQNGWTTDGGTIQQNGGTFKAYPVSANDVITIKSNIDRASIIAVVSTYNSSSFVFATGYSARVAIPTNTTQTLTIPSDGKYILVSQTLNGTSYIPQSILFNDSAMNGIENRMSNAESNITTINTTLPQQEFDSILRDFKKVNEIRGNNIINPQDCQNGCAFNWAGNIVTDASSAYIVSGYIPVNSDNPQISGKFFSANNVWTSGVVYDIYKHKLRTLGTSNTYTYQAGDYYVRFSFSVAGGDAKKCMANYGDTILDWESYDQMANKVSVVSSFNLIKPDSIVEKRFFAWGNGEIQTTTSSSYNICKDYIPVDGDVITNSNVGTQNAIASIVVYDSSKTFLRSILGNTYTYQSGDSYIRVGFKLAANNYAYYGSTDYGYIPYSVVPQMSDVLLQVKPKAEIIEFINELNYMYLTYNSVNTNRNYISKLWLSHHFRTGKYTNKPIRFDNGQRWYPFIPSSVATKSESIVSVNVVPDNQYADATLSVNTRLTNSATSKSTTPRILVIGDSVTEGVGAWSNKVVSWLPNQYWAFAKMLFEMDKIDGGDNSNEYNAIFIGRTDGNFTIHYNNVERIVRAKAEGCSGASLPELFDANWGAENRENPFYDANASGDNVFSISSYLSKYRTMDDNGNRLTLSDANVGSLIDTQEKLDSYDVCTPTHIVVNLNHNTEITDYLTYMNKVIARIHSELPSVPIIIMIVDETGTMFPIDYPNYKAEDITINGLHTKIIAMYRQILNNVQDEENGIYLLGANMIQPTADGLATIEYESADAILKNKNGGIKITNPNVAGANFHPNNNAHSAWGYFLYSMIKWLIS